MAITFGCPGCGAPFRLADDLAGKKGRCPKCSQTFTVPSEEETELRDDPPRKKRDESAVKAEKPRGGQWGEDDRDDMPVRRPRAKVRKKESNLPIILTIVGGLVVLLVVCGGAITALVLFAFIDAPDRFDARPFAIAPPAVAAAAGQGTRVNLANGLFEIQSHLAFDDPAARAFPANHSKRFLITLQAGKTYVIDHESDEYDPYLHVEGQSGAILAQDDDGGNDLDSRIQFSPPRTGDYIIVATTLDGDLGNFRLSIRESNLPPRR